MKKNFEFLKLRKLTKVRNENKIFCIGIGKTGTTSIERALKGLGFKTGNQREAELLLPYYRAKDFDPIISYCYSAQAFQDFPFGFPETYKYLDVAFPGSKFILSIRSNEIDWYNSVLNFHSKLFGKGRIPTADDLKTAEYVYKGWVWESLSLIFKAPEHDPFNKDILIKHYQDYNNEVSSYFKKRPKDLLILNVSQENAYKELCQYLNVDFAAKEFPWENKTSELKV